MRLGAEQSAVAASYGLVHRLGPVVVATATTVHGDAAHDGGRSRSGPCYAMDSPLCTRTRPTGRRLRLRETVSSGSDNPSAVRVESSQVRQRCHRAPDPSVASTPSSSPLSGQQGTLHIPLPRATPFLARQPLATDTPPQKIQFILRQTVYYLRETRAAPSVLRPSGVDAIPRPLAATLRSDAGPTPGGAEAGLGLYGARQEVAALREMVAALKVMRAQAGEGEGEGEEEGDGEGAEGDDGGDEVPGADDRMDAD